MKYGELRRFAMEKEAAAPPKGKGLRAAYQALTAAAKKVTGPKVFPRDVVARGRAANESFRGGRYVPAANESFFTLGKGLPVEQAAELARKSKQQSRKTGEHAYVIYKRLRDGLG